jgi:hypothetical protein
MQQTCLAYFGNMRIGKFAAPDTHVLRSGEAQYMSQTLMQLDTIKCGEHIWPNEKSTRITGFDFEESRGPGDVSDFVILHVSSGVRAFSGVRQNIDEKIYSGL